MQTAKQPQNRWEKAYADATTAVQPRRAKLTLRALLLLCSPGAFAATAQRAARPCRLRLEHLGRVRALTGVARQREGVRRHECRPGAASVGAAAAHFVQPGRGQRSQSLRPGEPSLVTAGGGGVAKRRRKRLHRWRRRGRRGAKRSGCWCGGRPSLLHFIVRGRWGGRRCDAAPATAAACGVEAPLRGGSGRRGEPSTHGVVRAVPPQGQSVPSLQGRVG